MSKGQFYDSDEEESAVKDNSSPRICWQIQNLGENDTREFDSALLVLNDIGKVLCETIVTQLKLTVIAKMKLSDEVVTEVYAADVNDDQNGEFVLIWNRMNAMPVEFVAAWFDMLCTRYPVKKWLLIDGLSSVNFPDVNISSKDTGVQGLRIIKASSSAILDESLFAAVTVPVLEAGVIVQGACAHVVNYCDVRQNPCVVVCVIRETAFTIEAAQRLELVWSWFDSLSSNKESKTIVLLEKPSSSAYTAQRKRDTFLINTDNLYS